MKKTKASFKSLQKKIEVEEFWTVLGCVTIGFLGITISLIPPIKYHCEIQIDISNHIHYPNNLQIPPTITITIIISAMILLDFIN